MQIMAILLGVSITINITLYLILSTVFADAKRCPYKKEHGCIILKTARFDYNKE